MSYSPQFQISSTLLNHVESITSFREKIQGASIDLSWIPALQKDTRTRNVHASTSIEGNPLTLEEVRALEEGQEIPTPTPRSKREITNYFAGLRYVEKKAKLKTIRHDHVLELHRILAGGDVMDQGEAGAYRTINVRVGEHFPPNHQDVSPLMFELLTWWNEEAPKLSPILSSSILHYQFENIHPFADGNGRTGRALALWELYRRGFDTHHIFSIDEYYWEDRPSYYAALGQVREAGEDLSQWLEYSAKGLESTLQRVWYRVQSYQQQAQNKLFLTPRQEELLSLLKTQGPQSPSQLWEALNLSKQGTLNILNPLLESGLIERIGTKKSGKYTLPIK